MRKTENTRQFFRSLEADSLKKRPLLTRMADDLTALCGSPRFLIINSLFFVIWIAINLSWVPGIAAFDPFPFGLLTMIVSLEAIFLSIFVLISQNRSSYTSTLRDEVQLQVNLIAEQEITKVLELLAEMRKQMGILKEDHQLTGMLERINETKIEKEIETQILEANSDLLRELRKDIPNLIHRAVNPSWKSGKATSEDR